MLIPGIIPETWQRLVDTRDDARDGATDGRRCMRRLLVVVSVSGGKDSTACALLARESDEQARFVFADTGHEHDETYRYVREYLPSVLGSPIEEVRADFAAAIERKRRYVAEKWPSKGVPQGTIETALRVLRPTGVPFLDLCLMKGRFPSRMAQFCTQELKRYPLDGFLADRLGEGYQVESWRGVRRDESPARRETPDRAPQAEGWTNVHPIADWTAASVVAYVQSRGVELNPLYRQGMGRVGCMPCINAGKNELAQIANRWPEHVARVRAWEDLVSQASKRGRTTFFTDSPRAIPTGKTHPGVDCDGEPCTVIEMRAETETELFDRLRIDSRVAWARTARGGRQGDLLQAMAPACQSLYGLCE